MSNLYLQAAEDAKGLLSKFETVKKVAEAFALVGGLQQAQAEVEAALPKAQAELAMVRNDVANEKVMLDTIRAEAKKTTANAKTVAEGIVEAAHAKAKAAIHEAEVSVLEVQGRERTTTANAAAEVAAATTKRDELLAEVKELESRADKARRYLSKLAE